MDTRELIRRDRENHKFKLETLDELPTNVMKQVNGAISDAMDEARASIGLVSELEWFGFQVQPRRCIWRSYLKSPASSQVVQDACRLLGLEDVSLLGPSVGKLIKAVQVLPRLERFVNR